jgi:hypothetical protein
MIEFLPRARPLILEHADVLEAAIAFQVLHALRAKQQELLNLAIVRVPDLAVVAGIFDQHLVRANRAHRVVEPFSAAARITFHPVERRGMHYGPRRPRTCVYR